MSKLLTRDDFRNSVFTRDGHACVFCGKTAEQTPEGKLDAHHIIERRLFTAPGEEGGYFLDNGATVCEHHHMLCETTEISTEEVRRACGIKKIVLPSTLYADHEYDKWGNVVLPNGNRLRGELFNDDSVQKVLRKGGVLDFFTHWVKYPRTHHLPWSPGITDDDRIIESLDAFIGQRVIVTTKMDGENSSLYRDYFHARSIDGRNHPSRNYVKGMWSQFCGDIPEGWRICAENLYAKHSIAYNDLPSYLMGFSIWDDKNVCLSWDETIEWFELLGITSVPVLYDGIFDEAAIKALYNEDKDWDSVEGYVIRTADAFAYGDFRRCVGKFVRKGHVMTAKHWMHGARMEVNSLKENSDV